MVYTTAIGFVIVHVLKITKNVEDSNEELLQTNKLLDDRLEKLILRLEKLEQKMATTNSTVEEAYANIIPPKQLKLASDTKGNTNDKLDKTGLGRFTGG